MNPLSLPIARLRAAGCKVSTIIGHDPNIGSFQYSVKLPDGIPAHYQFTCGHARLQSYPVTHDVNVRASVYTVGVATPKSLANAARVDCAGVMTALADHVEFYDQHSPLSIRHKAETGRFLTKGTS